MKTFFAFVLGAAVATLFLTQKKNPRIRETGATSPVLRLVPPRTENSEPEKPTLH